MIDKEFITNKLENFFKNTNLDEFLKIFFISFLYDKMNYMEKIVGYENSLYMLDKYIYNLEKNIKIFKKLDKYHSIYVQYSFKEKCIKYYMINEFKKFKMKSLSTEERKKIIIKEFKIMMYKEFEKVINIYSKDEKIVSNGFYIEDKSGRYPDYNGDFSSIIDIFAEVETCKILDLNEKFKVFVTNNKKYYLYSNHISVMNAEVLNYVKLWREFFNDELYYFAMNNPKKYSFKLIDEFNYKYEFILKENYNFLLHSKDVFSLIEKYLLHIKNRINIENNLRYHQDLSVIFKLMNQEKKNANIYDYLLHSVDENRYKLDFNCYNFRTNLRNREKFCVSKISFDSLRIANNKNK